MKKEEIDEFAEEVYRELQVPLATSYVPLSLEELKEINRNLYQKYEYIDIMLRRGSVNFFVYSPSGLMELAQKLKNSGIDVQICLVTIIFAHGNRLSTGDAGNLFLYANYSISDRLIRNR